METMTRFQHERHLSVNRAKPGPRLSARPHRADGQGPASRPRRSSAGRSTARGPACPSTTRSSSDALLSVHLPGTGISIRTSTATVRGGRWSRGWGTSCRISNASRRKPNSGSGRRNCEAEQRRRWYAAVALAREQQVEQHRARVLTGQTRAWRQAAEIRAFCQAARRARTGDTPVATDEADRLEWAEAYAEQLDPLRTPLRTPPDPPAARGSLPHTAWTRRGRSRRW